MADKKDEKDIFLVGSTNNIKTKQGADNFAYSSARVCYSEFDFSKLKGESKKNIIKLTDFLKKSGHHSPFDHIYLNFYLNNWSKALFMVLNNQSVYVTSEKSSRYTKMQLFEEQKSIYKFWYEEFDRLILNEYSWMQGSEQFDEKRGKLCKENARYMTSSFTPSKMVHSVSYRK